MSKKKAKVTTKRRSHRGKSTSRPRATIPPELRRERKIQVRCTEAESALWADLAREEGLSLSEWVRQQMPGGEFASEYAPLACRIEAIEERIADLDDRLDELEE